MNTNEKLQKILKQMEDTNKETQRINNEMVQILGDLHDIKYGVNKFHHAKIYKIVSENTDLCYIGSTTKTLQQRLKEHESSFKSFKNENSKYVTSFEILKLGNYQIELIEYVCVENEQELRKIEGKYQINELNKVNKFIAGRTLKEYYEGNKVKICENRKEHY